MSPQVIYGGPQRYELQWRGMSGNWWHGSWHRRRAIAVFKARALRPIARHRVIDHGEETNA